MKRMMVLTLLLMFGRSAGIAQWNISGGLQYLMDDNVNNNALQWSDRILTADVSAGYEWSLSGGELAASYGGTLGWFEAITDRSYFLHSAALSFGGTVDDDGEGAYKVELGGGMRKNQGAYSFYDNTQAGLSGSYRHILMEGITANAGYMYRYVSFGEAPFFSYHEHLASAGLTVNLPTRTTIIGSAELGQKRYTEGDPAGASDLPSLPEAGVTQWLLGLRVGQGIAEGTGLSLSGRYQWNPEKQSRYLVSEFGILSDDELFDDRYGYEGPGVTAMLTQVIMEGSYVKLSYGVQEKLYGLLPAFDLAGEQVDEHRQDLRTVWSLMWMTPIGSSGLQLSVAASMISNASNDPFYRYNNTAIGAGISIPF